MTTQIIMQKEWWKTDNQNRKEPVICINIKSLSTIANYSIQNRTLYQTDFLGFIAFTNSFQILKTWICHAKNSKSKFSCKRRRMLPQNEVNSKFVSIDCWWCVEYPPKAKGSFSNGDQVEFADVARCPAFLPLLKTSKTFETPPFSTICQN